MNQGTEFQSGETGQAEKIAYTPAYVAARLSDAGRTLRMLPATGCWPSSYRSFWPEIVRAYEEAYGYTEAEAPKVRPTMAQMNRLDEVLTWLPILAQRDGMQQCARILAVRMLTHPDTWKPMFSWRVIGAKFRLDQRTAKARHYEGCYVLASLLRAMS